MLKINLLPPSLNLRKQRNAAIAVVGVLVLAEVGFFIWSRNGPLAHQEMLLGQQAERNAGLQQLDPLVARSGQVAADEQALAPKRNFIEGLFRYNGEYPGLYSRVGRYTHGDVMLLNMNADQATMNMSAYVSRPEHVARLMLGLSRNPDFTGTPLVDGVPDYQTVMARRQAVMQRNDEEDMPETTIVGYPGGGGLPGLASGGFGAAAGGGSNGSGPGMMMPMPGGPMAGAMGGGSNGSGGGSGMGMPMPSMAGGSAMPGGSSMGGPMGMGGNNNNNGAGLAALRLARVRRQPVGFTVSIKCQLAKPVGRPTFGSSGQAQGGGGGGMGGGMGAPMGMGGGNGSGGMGMPGGGSSGGPPMGMGGGNGGGAPMGMGGGNGG